MAKVAAGTLHQFRKPRKFQRPQMTLPYQDAAWWVLSKLDSAVVSAPDGTTAAWYQRDRKQFRALARRSAVLHLRLVMNWPQAGQGVPCRRGGVHLAGQMAGDLRGVARGPAWWAVSQASLGQNGKAPSPAEPAGTPAPALPAAADWGIQVHRGDCRRRTLMTEVRPAQAAHAAGGGAARGPGGGGRAAARYAPAGAAALVMVVLGLWGLARDSAMGNDEVATRWAALLSLRELAHLLNNVRTRCTASTTC